MPGGHTFGAGNYNLYHMLSPVCEVTTQVFVTAAPLGVQRVVLSLRQGGNNWPGSIEDISMFA